jgi:hypothetical protein
VHQEDPNSPGIKTENSQEEQKGSSVDDAEVIKLIEVPLTDETTEKINPNECISLEDFMRIMLQIKN